MAKSAKRKYKTRSGRTSAKTSKSRGTSKKNTMTAKERAALKERRKNVIFEVCVWIVIAASVFLFLSNFGICGIVGEALRNVMLGLFGSMGFVFPILLIVIVCFIMIYRKKAYFPVSRIVALALLFIDGCLLFQLFPYAKTSISISRFYDIGTLGTVCGGVLGALLSNTFCRLLGMVGALIIAIALFIISIVMLTQRSIVDAVTNRHKDKKTNTENAGAANGKNGKDKKNGSNDQNVAKKRKVKVQGVNLNETKIDPNEQNATSSADIFQDMHEVHSDSENNIHINGLDENQSNPSFVENTITGTEKEDEDAINGEFTPKEHIELSENAKDTMKRKPYDVSGESINDESVSVQKKASSEGKIISPKSKELKYKKPPYSLLKDHPKNTSGATRAQLMQNANKLKQILANFGVHVEVTDVSRGPSVTRYELMPEMGTKVSRITALADDIKLNMAASDIRIEAPIPGKAAVGIEIPNEGREPVYLKELLMSREIRENKSPLAFPVGKDLAGKVVVADIAKMPHLLIAGTTGAGKSVFTNSILMSILYRTTPEQVRMIVIDPKVVEFQVYNRIPHLLYDVVTDPKKAAGILNWAVAEMTSRYKKFADTGARDIDGYNARVESSGAQPGQPQEKMPQILIVIDELADLMMVAAKEVEESICRLAQLARAAGIHMVIATQRPSVDVITGLIKANIPSRVALTVASGTDSRTIIDMNGAEKLLGNGDMLFYPAGYIKPVRVQGAFVSDGEIRATVDYIKGSSGEASYEESIDKKLSEGSSSYAPGGSDRDIFFADAGRLCIEKQKGSTSMLQRQFKIGFNRAARIMDQLYEAGVVGQEESGKPRKVVMSMNEFESLLSQKEE